MSEIPSAFNPLQQEHDLSSKITVALERIGEVFRLSLWEQAKQLGLSPIQIQILLFLHYHPQIQLKTVSALAREFQLTKPTISDAVRVLVKKEILFKESNQHDSRSYQLFLTAKGKGLIQQLGPFASEIHQSIAKLSEPEQQSMFQALLTLLSDLNRKSMIQTQRMCYKCQYFQSASPNQLAYCKLLQRPLAIQDIRIDCPDFLAL